MPLTGPQTVTTYIEQRFGEIWRTRQTQEETARQRRHDRARNWLESDPRVVESTAGILNRVLKAHVDVAVQKAVEEGQTTVQVSVNLWQVASELLGRSKGLLDRGFQVEDVACAFWMVLQQGGFTSATEQELVFAVELDVPQGMDEPPARPADDPFAAALGAKAPAEPPSRRTRPAPARPAGEEAPALRAPRGGGPGARRRPTPGSGAADGGGENVGAGPGTPGT